MSEATTNPELKKQTMTADDGTVIEYYTGSGNVFADLGLPDAEELFFKCGLMHRISQLIAAQGWAQAQAARELGITQPRVSQIINGRADGFSTDMLLKILNKLGCDVEIRVKKRKAKSPGHTRAVLTA